MICALMATYRFHYYQTKLSEKVKAGQVVDTVCMWTIDHGYINILKSSGKGHHRLTESPEEGSNNC